MRKLSVESEKLDKSLSELQVMELQTVLLDSKKLVDSVRSAIHYDTLNLDFAVEMDQFLTAYKNAETLEKEYDTCEKSFENQVIRIRFLKNDIEAGTGDRSAYQKNIQAEQQDLTALRSHFQSIQSRFIQLKDSKRVFEPLFNAYCTSKS